MREQLYELKIHILTYIGTHSKINKTMTDPSKNVKTRSCITKFKGMFRESDKNNQRGGEGRLNLILLSSVKLKPSFSALSHICNLSSHLTLYGVVKDYFKLLQD